MGIDKIKKKSDCSDDLAPEPNALNGSDSRMLKFFVANKSILDIKKGRPNLNRNIKHGGMAFLSYKTKSDRSDVLAPELNVLHGSDSRMLNPL